MPSNHLILCHSLLLPPSIFPSIRVFSSESVLRIRWPKDRSFSFSISPSKEYSRLISFRIDWFDRLVPQGTLKSVLQHHISKASVFWHSDFSSTNLENIQGWDFDLRKKKKSCWLTGDLAPDWLLPNSQHHEICLSMIFTFWSVLYNKQGFIIFYFVSRI